MKKSWFLFPVIIVLLMACKHKHNHAHDEHSNEGHSKDSESHQHKHHGANKHMHKSSIDDLIERFESPERDEYQKPEKVMEYLGDIKGETIMEIGSGSGYFTTRLAKAGAKVIAGDVDTAFLNYIKEKISTDELKGLPIVLKELPYDSPEMENESVDKVFLVNTYHHIEERSAYFAKVKAGLKPSGALIVVDFFKKEAPFGPPIEHKLANEQVIEELKQAGFSNFEKEMDLLPYQYIIKASF